MGKISQLYNKDKQKIYPVTLSDAVVDSKTGKAISNQLNNLNINNTQYYQIKLSKDNWDAQAKTISVNINTSGTFVYNNESMIVYVYPYDDSAANYKNAGIECVGIADNVIFFNAKVMPVSDINVCIFIIEREINICCKQHESKQ